MVIDTSMSMERRDELADLDELYNGPPRVTDLLLARPRRVLMELAARLLEEEARRESARPPLAAALDLAAATLRRAVGVLDGLDPLPESGLACFDECEAARAARAAAAGGTARAQG